MEALGADAFQGKTTANPDICCERRLMILVRTRSGFSFIIKQHENKLDVRAEYSALIFACHHRRLRVAASAHRASTGMTGPSPGWQNSLVLQEFIPAFAGVRPFLGPIFFLTTSLIPPVPLYWQIFALLIRFIAVLSAWFALSMSGPVINDKR